MYVKGKDIQQFEYYYASFARYIKHWKSFMYRTKNFTNSETWLNHLIFIIDLSKKKTDTFS